MRCRAWTWPWKCFQTLSLLRRVLTHLVQEQISCSVWFPRHWRASSQNRACCNIWILSWIWKAALTCKPSEEPHDSIFRFISYSQCYWWSTLRGLMLSRFVMLPQCKMGMWKEYCTYSGIHQSLCWWCKSSILLKFKCELPWPSYRQSCTTWHQ